MKPAQKVQSPTETQPLATATVRVIPLSSLASNPAQPRQHWDDEKDENGHTSLDRLAESIRKDGILQPLVVTNRANKYLIVCGERRYRAARMAGLKEAPCVLRPGLTDEQAIEVGLVENLQREDLTPIDEAHAIDALMKKCRHTQATIARRLGVSVAAVNYKLGLLKLSPELQKEVRKGRLSETQGRKIVQAVNKLPDAKREAAMNEVRQKVGAARDSRGRVNAKEVATIAKSVAEKHTQPARNAKDKGDKKHCVRQPTPKEKAQAKAFARAVSASVKGFKGFEKTLSEKDYRGRLVLALLSTQAGAIDAVKGLYDVLGRVLEEAAEVRRERMVARLK